MPPAKRVTFIYRNYEGLGIGYLASYVRSLGHQVQLVLYPDPWSDTYVKQKDKDSPMVGRLQTRVDRQLLREIVEFAPDLICFSTVTDDYQWCLRTAGTLKAATGAVTIFGGVHVSSVPERVVVQPNVDLIGLGEGERALGALLEQLDDWKAGADLRIPGIWYERDGETIRTAVARRSRTSTTCPSRPRTSSTSGCPAWPVPTPPPRAAGAPTSAPTATTRSCCRCTGRRVAGCASGRLTTSSRS
jgi:radical SAM superfamily enzyme YgiQ (UPF0313 family)